VNLELVMAPALRPLRIQSQTLTGVVVDSNRKPVAGARVGVYWDFNDYWTLETLTDKDGRYLLCGLSESTWREGILRATSDGMDYVFYFLPEARSAPLGSGEFVLDVQMKKRP
jgi:hypothetical protein